MTDVNFYVQTKPQKQGELACRLCRRVAIQAKQRLLVLLPSTHAISVFDDLLWTFDPSSFLPHSLNNSLAPIYLSQSIPDDFIGSCLNLTPKTVDPLRFNTVLELITQSEEAKTIGREKFLTYRTLGFEPVTHHV